MLTNSAYLAAYRGSIAHSDCVKIVRGALRETGPALPAGAPLFLDTGVATGDQSRAIELPKRIDRILRRQFNYEPITYV